MKKNKKPSIVITLGDPCGIGPEIVAKALCDPRIQKSTDCCVVGDYHALVAQARQMPKKINFLDLKILDHKIPLGRACQQGGAAALAYLDTALSLLKAGQFSALVTAPVCKQAVQLIQPGFKGHTEHLAKFFGVKNYDMMFVAKDLKVVVATRHIPLSKVSREITMGSLYQTICLTAESLKKFFKIANPKIAVCGLNPHAGEGGRIGREEQRVIIPAIKKAQRLFKNLSGPFAADTVFCPMISKKFDAVIAMYHDQGTIPVKMASFHELVNFTIGLPIIRTSPAHGTAFDIAGKNQADPSSMIQAITLAAQLSK